MRRLAKGVEELKDFLVSAAAAGGAARRARLTVAAAVCVQAVNGEDAALAATDNLETARRVLAELAPEEAGAAGAEEERRQLRTEGLPVATPVDGDDPPGAPGPGGFTTARPGSVGERFLGGVERTPIRAQPEGLRPAHERSQRPNT
jgi:hypothetical protein